MGMGGMMGGLPGDYAEFSERINQSADGQVRYTLNSGSGAKTLVLGVRLDDALLYISTPLDPLGVTIEILRRQLLYVSIVALLMGLVIAFFIARRFTRPVTAITSQAGALAEGRFPESFDKGFCSELDHLSDTLTYASRELGKVEGLRRELIANVSHDLKTPLTMIKAYSELIRDISGDNKVKREAHLGVISSEVDRLEKLVSDILSLSQAQSGSMPLDMEALDIGETVARVMARFEPLFTSEGYQFHAEIEPDQTAQADARRIEQVLYNLIGNAMNYIGGDKTVYVRVKGNSDAVRVEVSDRGEGIAEEDLPRIWERYYKAKDHVRDKAGTGLGLSIVKGILETHRARFGVKSRTGEGSTFWFELRR
jgi:signal transduction histidine kinase